MKMHGLAQFCENEFVFLPSGRPKAAAAAVGGGQRCGNGEFRTNHRRDHHLRDPLAAADHKRRIAVIDQDHADLAAIVRIDRAGRIEHGDAMSGREARARPHLGLKARRQRDREPSRYRRVFSGR